MNEGYRHIVVRYPDRNLKKIPSDLAFFNQIPKHLRKCLVRFVKQRTLRLWKNPSGLLQSLPKQYNFVWVRR